MEILEKGRGGGSQFASPAIGSHQPPILLFCRQGGAMEGLERVVVFLVLGKQEQHLLFLG